MDEEDLQSFGGKQLVANSQFDAIESMSNDVQQQAHAMASGSQSAIPGPAPDELIMPACQPVGKRLLELFGWKEGQGIGPKRVSQRLSSQVRLPPSSLQQSSSVLPHGPSFLFAPKNTAVFDPKLASISCPVHGAFRGCRALSLRSSPDSPLFHLTSTSPLTYVSLCLYGIVGVMVLCKKGGHIISLKLAMPIL